MSLDINLTNVQSKPIVVSANQTAENDRVYHVIANATFTDPSPAEGKGYRVFVRNGTATIGGVAYGTLGTIVVRTFHSGSWSTVYFFDYITSNNLFQSRANLSTNVNTDQASNSKYPSVKAVFDWATNLFFPKPTGTTSQYLRGDGTVATFPTIPDTSDFVEKSDFTSHSILAKQSGASDPVAVSIGNNEILGRKSGGGSNIEGLSVSEVKSLLGYTASDVGAVATNSAITGATKTKITYDAKGLVTVGADATTADIADSVNKRYVTDANLTVIGNTSNTNTGDETQSSIFSKLKLSIKKGIGYAPVTGTTLETLVGTLSFDANAFETSDNLRIIANCQRSGTTGTAAIMRVKVNSVNDFATATTIATIATTNSAHNNFGLVRENFTISGGNLTGYPFTTSALTDNALLAVTLGSVAVDVTQPLYFFVSLANATTTESNVVRTFKISNI
jgi:hypothetical protein